MLPKTPSILSGATNVYISQKITSPILLNILFKLIGYLPTHQSLFLNFVCVCVSFVILNLL
jgi:hypothetical protein